MTEDQNWIYGSLIKIDDTVEGKQKAGAVGSWCFQSEFILWVQTVSVDKIRSVCYALSIYCRFSIFILSPLASHTQVIKATIERHKQNSETFNKAFNSSFSREDDHVPESPVSVDLPSPLITLLWSQSEGHHVQWIMADEWCTKRLFHSLAFVCQNSPPSMDVGRITQTKHYQKEALYFHM